MSIFRLDYVNGNDNRGGDSWAVTLTNADGQTYGTTKFTSISGGFTGLINRYIYIASTTPFWGKIIAVVSDTEVTLSGTIAIQVGISFWIGGAWKDITNGATSARMAPGDTVRIAKSSDPTSLGINGSWTTAPTTLPTSKNIVSSTNAGPINININAHGYVTGDSIYIQNHTLNLTANGTWTITWVDNNNFTLDNSIGIAVGGATGSCTKINWHCVKIDSALTQTITRCEQAWTLANASTVTLDTTLYKEGDASAKIVKASPANSTLYAYFATGTLNLSSYQKISFWIRNDQVITANQWQLCLCSDVAGAVIVDTFAIPAIPSTGRWLCLTLVGDNVNLGVSIKSVALYSGSSAGTTSGIYLDNIIACTTSGLNLQSLISKNSLAQGGTEGFYGIQSISEDGKIIRLDNDTNTLASDKILAGGGYSGVSETVITYKRETIKTVLVTTSSQAVQECQESGTLGNLESFEGGYNPTNDTQDGETFFDGLNGFGYGLYLSSKNYISLNYINFSRYYYGLYVNTSNNFTINTLTNVNNNSYYGIMLSSVTYSTINTLTNVNNNAYYGIYFYYVQYTTINTLTNVNNNNNGGFILAYSTNLTINTITNANNNNYGVTLNNSCNNTINTITNVNNNGTDGTGIRSGLYFSSSYYNTINTITNANNNNNGIKYSNSYYNTINTITNANNNNNYGVFFENSISNTILNLSTTGNTTSAIYCHVGRNYIQTAVMTEGTPFSGAFVFANAFIFSNKVVNGGITNNYYIYTDGGNIVSDATANRHTLSGICWKLSPTSINRSSIYPLFLPIAKIACIANKLVTVKAWFKVTNITDIRGKLVCRGGQISGVVTDVTVTTSNINTNYEELTITFTPTEAGVVEIEAWAYWTAGGADESVYVDDMTISQAD